MPRIGSPTAAMRAGIVSSVNTSGSTRRDLVPEQRRRDARVRRGADRVRRGDRPVARVLAVVDEHADAIGDAPRRRRDRLVVDTALDLDRKRLREAANLGKRQLGLDRREDVEARRARRLRVRAQPELVHHLAHDERDLAHERPLAVARRVEVDQQIVGLLDLRDARRPRVQLDASEVRDPRERLDVVDDREDRRVAARELHEDLVDEVGMLRRHALLVEELALDAVREALHVERPAAEMGESLLGHADVVGDEIALRQSPLREEQLVGVRDLDGSEYRGGMLEGHPLANNVTLEPLDDYVVAPAARRV